MRTDRLHHPLLRGLLPVIAATLFLWGGPAAAQTVYRCGPEGRSYSQQPCADGRAVDVSDSRDPGQQAEAQARRQGDIARAAQAGSTRPAEPPRGAGILHTRRPPVEEASAAGAPSRARKKTSKAERPVVAVSREAQVAPRSKKKRR